VASLSPTSAPAGATRAALDALIDLGLTEAAVRREAFAIYEALPAPKSPGAKWKHDLRKLDLGNLTVSPAPILALAEPLSVPGAIVCDFATARRDHAELFGPAYDRALANETKFGALTRAFAPDGLFIAIAEGVKLAEPIRLGLVAIEGADALPYVIVAAGARSQVEIIELAGGDTGGRLVCSATEIAAGDDARVSYSILQQYGPQTKAIATRRATIGRNAEVHIAFAAIGAQLCVEDIAERATEPGAGARMTGLFFASEDQHVDVLSDLQHVVGSTTSDTVVKGVAGDRARARFLGNITIAAHAHGSEATLRDDSLLLSPEAHIDSVPALEISANDVKAFHGATVGALDDENLFYIMSRGLDRTTAERLVTLGFLEPAIARFPSEAVREHLRSALGAKLG
jgi:Fe-S cluster assembly protein SufD